MSPASACRRACPPPSPARILLSTALFVSALLLPAPRAAAQTPATPAAACQPATGWSQLDGEGPRQVAASVLLAEMARRDVVLLGERHDDADHHRWQLHTLAALHAQRPAMVLGFEMFPRRLQPVLDRWVAGELSEKAFLREVEWDRVWSFPAEYYLPLFQFARIHRIPMVALNVERSLTRAISEKGWDGVPEAQREGVGRPAAPPPAYRSFLRQVFQQHQGMHGAKGGAANARAQEYFIQSQITWDRAMAEALAARLGPPGAPARPLLVGIMGSGHLRNGHGVPHQLRDLGVRSIGTLLPLSADPDCAELQPGLADAVFVVPAQAADAPDPPRLGVQLEEHAGGVRIALVSPSSLAERSGLQNGDRLLEVGGMPAHKASPVVDQIRRQPAGSWLPLRVQRGNDTLDLVVKFPAER